MSALAKREIHLSPEEYLSGEAISECRHEFLNGVVYAMSGGSLEHARIGVRIASLLDASLRGKPCLPFNSDMKLQIKRGLDHRFYYPDVMVVCHPRPRSTWQDQPVVLFEVLSPSTERTDRTEKFTAYTGIASLRQYVLIDSESIEVTSYVRDAAGEWPLLRLHHPDDVLLLPEIDCRLPLREIYEAAGLLP